jgi:cobalt-zinc-cadmium efflux system outer membrane protein
VTKIFSMDRFVPTASILVLLSSLACAGEVERKTKSELDRVAGELADLPVDEATASPGAGASERAIDLDGSLRSYVAHAYANSPELRASFEQWRAATFAPDRVRKMPEPTLTYAVFLSSVETRVGPQRHKLGVMQWFPWPTKLTAAGKAEALRAESAQRRFEAHALEISSRVARAYWRLWLIQRTREVRTEQVVVLEGLSEQVRFRMETGAADLGNVAQINLGISRLRDAIAGLDEAERSASATLVEAIGAPGGTPTPIASDSPAATRPTEEASALAENARRHPRVEAMALQVEATEEDVRAARASYAPSLGIGIDWIITGDAVDPTMAQSGKDAVIMMGSVRIPLWTRAYRAGVRQAQARGAMYRAREVAAKNTATADVERQLAAVRDSERRVTLYRGTLVPQAQAVYGSVLGSYEAGRAGVADVLLAERDLLDLEVGRFVAEAEHAIAWAELEKVVGRPLHGKETG